MNNYCKHHRAIGAPFGDGTILTDITIPPSCGEQLLLFVFQTVIENGGKVWSNPAFGMDGSILLTPVTFQSDDGREKCCNEINEAIGTVLKSQQAIFTPVEGEEGRFEIRLNFKFLFIQFHDFMEKIKPVVGYIENNGGWFDHETTQFPGLDALEKARADGTMEPEQAEKIETALLIFGNFMAAYTIGMQIFGDAANTAAIVPHEETD